MTSLTIKNLPENIYQHLKKIAAKQHRSLNSEIIYRLEQSLQKPSSLRVAESEIAYQSIQQHENFIKTYQAEHHYQSQSDVIKDALHLLQQKQLEASYKEANEEIDSDFDATSGDGIDDETW